MKIYHVNTFGAAIIFAFLCMGMLALFVLIPILCIQWTWNAVVSYISLLPEINLWQAGLLYLACATLLYISGFVQIDFEHNS